MIYADHAATTPLSPAALDAMMPFLTGGYGNPSQPYSISREPRKAVEKARETVARCINADVDEIYFTSGGTEGDNWAIKMTDGNVVTSAIEHHAVLRSAGARALNKAQVDANGAVIQSALIEKLDNIFVFVTSIMLANNEIGTIEPIDKLCRAVKEKSPSVLFHTDAVAAVGHIPVDVKALGVDMLTASAHKFGGPRGVGFIYIKRGVKIKPYMTGGGQERWMRAGTENVAGIAGMAAALQESIEKMDERAAMLRELEGEFLGTLQAAGADFIRNGGGVPGLVNVSFRGADGEMLLHRLDLKDIYVSTGSACNAGDEHTSHVLEAIGVREDYIKGTIRVSFGAANKAGDGEAAAREIVNILKDTLIAR